MLSTLGKKTRTHPSTNFPIDVAEEREHHFPICFSPIGNLLGYVSIGAPHHTLTISDIETGKHIADLHCSASLVYRGLVFSPCGQYLAAVNQNTEVLVWNVYNGILETEPTIYDGRRLIPTYTPDGTLRVADIYDHQVVIWDAIRKEKIDTFECHDHRHDRFSIDGAHHRNNPCHITSSVCGQSGLHQR